MRTAAVSAQVSPLETITYIFTSLHQIFEEKVFWKCTVATLTLNVRVNWSIWVVLLISLHVVKLGNLIILFCCAMKLSEIVQKPVFF